MSFRGYYNLAVEPLIAQISRSESSWNQPCSIWWILSSWQCSDGSAVQLTPEPNSRLHCGSSTQATKVIFVGRASRMDEARREEPHGKKGGRGTHGKANGAGQPRLPWPPGPSMANSLKATRNAHSIQTRRNSTTWGTGRRRVRPKYFGTTFPGILVSHTVLGTAP